MWRSNVQMWEVVRNMVSLLPPTSLFTEDRGGGVAWVIDPPAYLRHRSEDTLSSRWTGSRCSPSYRAAGTGAWWWGGGRRDTWRQKETHRWGKQNFQQNFWSWVSHSLCICDTKLQETAWRQKQNKTAPLGVIEVVQSVEGYKYSHCTTVEVKSVTRYSSRMKHQWCAKRKPNLPYSNQRSTAPPQHQGHRDALFFCTLNSSSLKPDKLKILDACP